jgi:tRNA nucleotidyltransferase (CCA-adding enzyme)
MRLLERCDALRRPARFEQVLLACECDARGRTGREQAPYLQRERLRAALARALAVDTAVRAAEVQAQGLSGEAVGAAIRRARIDAIAQGLALGTVAEGPPPTAAA